MVGQDILREVNVAYVWEGKNILNIITIKKTSGGKIVARGDSLVAGLPFLDIKKTSGGTIVARGIL